MLEASLRKLFVTFPDGLPGFALLVLRAALGITVVVQGRLCLSDVSLVAGAGVPAWWLGLAAVITGSLLMLGLVTQLAGSIVALGGLGTGVAVLPTCLGTVFDSRMAILFAATNLLAVILLGPGRFSLDARIFGRREIIIPRP